MTNRLSYFYPPAGTHFLPENSECIKANEFPSGRGTCYCHLIQSANSYISKPNSLGPSPSDFINKPIHIAINTIEKAKYMDKLHDLQQVITLIISQLNPSSTSSSTIRKLQTIQTNLTKDSRAQFTLKNFRELYDRQKAELIDVSSILTTHDLLTLSCHLSKDEKLPSFLNNVKEGLYCLRSPEMRLGNRWHNINLSNYINQLTLNIQKIRFAKLCIIIDPVHTPRLLDQFGITDSDDILELTLFCIEEFPFPATFFKLLPHNREEQVRFQLAKKLISNSFRGYFNIERFQISSERLRFELAKELGEYSHETLVTTVEKFNISNEAYKSELQSLIDSEPSFESRLHQKIQREIQETNSQFSNQALETDEEALDMSFINTLVHFYNSFGISGLIYHFPIWVIECLLNQLKRLWT